MEALNAERTRALSENGEVSADINPEPVIERFESETGEVEVLNATAEEVEAASRSCDHVKKWRDRSKLQILRPTIVSNALGRNNKELRLFHLFATRELIDGVRKWTCESMREKQQTPPSATKFNACIGLEIATSIAKLNSLSDYWSKKMFLGCPDFSSVMSREDFQKIRSSLTLHPKYVHESAVADPLWHSRHFLNHFIQNAASIAVPLGATSLDETTIRCKARTLARTCMKSKPTKHGIRFYSVVSWKEAYLHTLWDNGSGNETGLNPAETYCELFRGLRGVFHKKFSKNSPVSAKKPSALWIMQLAHQRKLHKDPSGERLVVMDNFYTRHPLARQLARVTDGEMKILGTVRLNNIDKMNRSLVKQAVERSSNKEKGHWLLAQAFHADARGIPEVSPRAGCIIFKDRATVAFYSNDLAKTPAVPLQEATDDAVVCVHGLISMSRWRGHESFHRSVIKVPSLVLACNAFMNGVDRFDQLRSTNAIARKEKRVSMSLFTFMLDAAILNAYALHKQESDTPLLVPREFKRRIAEAFVTPELMKRLRNAREMSTVEEAADNASAEASPSTTHYLLENIGRKFVNCCFCSEMTHNERQRKTMLGCFQRQKGFHANCFAMCHFPEVVRCKRSTAQRLIEKNRGSRSIRKRNGRKPLSIGSIETCALPFLSQ